MLHNPAVRVSILAAGVVALVGCMPKMTVEQMKAEMPKRPAELNHLEDLVGKWEGDGEVRMAMLDEPLKMHGVSEVTWGDPNKWFVVERGEYTMGPFDPMRGLGTWTYDTGAKKFRSTWTDSMGCVGIGEATYNEATSTWRFTASSYGPWGKSSMSGEMKLVGRDTMEYKMTEHQGLTKVMEMSGTSKRRR
jgi:hypothetical protein